MPGSERGKALSDGEAVFVRFQRGGKIAIIVLNLACPKQALHIIRIERKRLLISLKRPFRIGKPGDRSEIAIGHHCFFAVLSGLRRGLLHTRIAFLSALRYRSNRYPNSLFCV
ncbi:MAG TPA: hypothetical protein VFG05_06665 [Methylocella sp.]|nr:hypothetical protein [Methylocella sp.]